MPEFTYEIKEKVETLSVNPKGWAKEVNLIAWNGGTAKYDIREWSPEHDKMGKGITITEEEAQLLYQALKKIYG